MFLTIFNFLNYRSCLLVTCTHTFLCVIEVRPDYRIINTRKIFAINVRKNASLQGIAGSCMIDQ